MPYRLLPHLGLSVLLLFPYQLRADAGYLQGNYDLSKPPNSVQDAPKARLVGAAGDGLGHTIRTGDLNGDGRSDLIAATEAGKIYVWFGSASFQGEFDSLGLAGTSPQLVITGFSTLRAMAVGDVNGDSRDDLIIGFTPTEQGGGNGAIVLGRVNFAPILDMEKTGSTGASVLIQAAQTEDDLTEGHALALGDFNGDGKVDIALGAPTADHWGRMGSGAAFIIFGRSSFPTVLDLGRPGILGFSVAIAGAAPGDALTLGGAMHAADVTGDGTDDLLLGAPGGDGPGKQRSGAGEVYVIAGRNTLTSGEEMDIGLQGTHHGASLTLYGAYPGDALSSEGRIGSGDINGDGIRDILLSAPFANGPQSHRQDAGQAYVVLGRPNLPVTLDMRFSGSSSGDETQRGADVILHGGSPGDRLTHGGALAAGDVNGDGVEDLIAGAHDAPNVISGGAGAGQIHIVFGRRNLATNALVVDAQNGAAIGPDVTIYGARPGDHLSRSGALVMGDLDGDGLADVIAGSDAAGGGGGSRPNSGRGYMVAGRNRFPRSLNLLQEGDIADGASVHLRGAESGDNLTQNGAFLLADLNGDGDSDLVVGAPNADGPANSRPDAGELYFVRGVSREEIGALTADDIPIIDGDVVNLGQVGMNTEATFSFTLTNSGRRTLYLQNGWLDGADATAFAITPPFEWGWITARSTKTLAVKFKSKSLGTKTATLIVNNSDGDESPFRIVLTLEVMKALPPVVKTVSAQPGVTTATVSGLVNPKGHARRVFVDFGVSPKLDQTLELLPSLTNGSAEVAVNGTLTFLYPHTRYSFRLRSESVQGSAVGATMTFTTGNSGPIAQNDTFAVTPGSTVTLPALSNDYDPDGDGLQIVSFTQAMANGERSGKLVKTGNALVFSAPAEFTTEVTFGYSIKDHLGASGSATVTVTPGAATIDPMSITMDARYGFYRVDVTSDSLWSVSESASWLTAEIDTFEPPPGTYYPAPPPLGPEPPRVYVNLLPNNTVHDRSAIVMIAGQQHQVLQKAVTQPTLAIPASGVPEGLVGSSYSLQLLTGTDPATYSLSSPARWLTNYQGQLSGVPTSAGTFPVKVTAKNAAGKAELEFAIVIHPLHPTFAGSYLGFVNLNNLAPSGRGGRLEMTATSSGAVSGKVFSGTAAKSFTTKIRSDVNDPDFPEAYISISHRNALLSVSITFDAAQQTFTGLTGSYPAGKVTGWRNGWSKTNRASAYSGLHTFALRLRDTAGFDSRPEGYGYGSFTVNEGSGAVTVSGKLPDNQKFSTAGFIGPQGQLLLYQPVYSSLQIAAPAQGIFAGVIQVIAGGAPAGNAIGMVTDFEPVWVRPASKDRNYGFGFGPALVEVEGGAYAPPPSGGLVFGLTPVAGNARLRCTGGGLAGQLEQELTLQNPKAAGLINSATPVPPALLKFDFPAFNAATGAFRGSFVLPGTTAALNRKLSFEGQIVGIGAEMKGYGFFLLPKLPESPGETMGNTFILSGQTFLEPSGPTD